MTGVVLLPAACQVSPLHVMVCVMIGEKLRSDSRLCGWMQAQKDLIESMIAEDDKIGGLEHVECKVFK